MHIEIGTKLLICGEVETVQNMIIRPTLFDDKKMAIEVHTGENRWHFAKQLFIAINDGDVKIADKVPA